MSEKPHVQFTPEINSGYYHIRGLGNKPENLSLILDGVEVLKVKYPARRYIILYMKFRVFIYKLRGMRMKKILWYGGSFL